EIVALEGVRRACRIDPLGGVSPRLAVERDVADRSGEPAFDELRGRGDPAVDVRSGEVAALEARLAGTHAAQVGALESALAEGALAPAGEERVKALVEELAAKVAALERATVRSESLERGAAEGRVAECDPI